MKLFEIMQAADDSWAYFLSKIESVVGGKLNRLEGTQAYSEWEQGGSSAMELARWILNDRRDGEYKNQDRRPEVDDDFDYTDYSMRQAERGGARI